MRPAAEPWRNTAGWVLLALGLSQMVADIAGWNTLKAVAAATVMAPAPKVFSSVKGLETFSTRFVLEWMDTTGREHSLELSAERYSQVRGPYNRRNIYGAVLAYGPILVSDPRTQPLFDSVARYGLCGDAPLLSELGIDADEVRNLRVRYYPLHGSDSAGLADQLEVPCH